jgi:hypothetical protein
MQFDQEISAEVKTNAAPAQVRVIANFALQHLTAATIFRDHVIALETQHVGEPIGPFYDELRSYASACIMSAAASLEALINEFFLAHGSSLRDKLTDFEQEFWDPKKGIEGERPLEKYQIALDKLGASRFVRDKPPYIDADALIELRNALVHHKPTWDPARKRRVRLDQLLAGRFEVSPFKESSGDLVSIKCMSAGCARWAVETVFAFMHEFIARTDLDPNKMVGFWNLENPAVSEALNPATRERGQPIARDIALLLAGTALGALLVVILRALIL